MNPLAFIHDWPSEVVAAVFALVGVLVGTAMTWLAATRDLLLRRRVETTKVFQTTSTRAHGLRDDGSPVGPGEQIAAMYQLADLASRDKWLRLAGESQLDDEHDRLDIAVILADLDFKMHRDESAEAGQATGRVPDEMVQALAASGLNRRAQYRLRRAARTARDGITVPRRTRAWAWVKSDLRKDWARLRPTLAAPVPVPEEPTPLPLLDRLSQEP